MIIETEESQEQVGDCSEPEGGINWDHMVSIIKHCRSDLGTAGEVKFQLKLRHE